MHEQADGLVQKSLWLFEARDYSNAEREARRALRLAPAFAAAHQARGLAVLYLQRLPEAEQAFRRAHATAPPGVRSRFYLAAVLRETDRPDEAEGEFKALLDLPLPADLPRAEIARRLGSLLLSRGRFAEGWRYYEERRAGEEPGAFPRWSGEDLAGKSIVLWPEQGYGDIVQFAR